MFKMRLNRRTTISGFATIAFVLISSTYEWSLAGDDPQKQGDNTIPPADRQKPQTDDANGGLSNPATAASNASADTNKSTRKKVRMSGMIGLIMNDSVLKELGIEKGSEEQAELRKLASFSTELSKRVNQLTDEDRAERLTAYELYSKVESEQVVKLKERLKPEQYVRWRQIWLQQHGLQSIDDTDVASALGISDEQQAKIAAANVEIANKRKALQEERKELVASGTGLEEIVKKLRQLDEERNTKYQEVLTPEQLEKFNQMKGQPFELAFSPPRTFPDRRAGMPIHVRSGGLMTFALQEPVLKEIGIDPDAPVVAEIRKLSEVHRQEVRQALRGNIEKAYENGEKLQAKYYPELKKLMTPEQFTRLQQVEWQRRGIGALDDPDLRNALEITGEQRKQLDDVTVEVFTKGRDLLNPPGGRVVGEPLDSDARAKMQVIRAEHEKRVNQILSTRQQAKFAELKGKPFDLTPLR